MDYLVRLIWKIVGKPSKKVSVYVHRKKGTYGIGVDGYWQNCPEKSLSFGSK